MDIENHFKEIVKSKAEGIDYERIYRCILEDNEYCLVEIRTMILVNLYNLELNHCVNGNTEKHKAILASYLHMIGKEKLRPQILIEHLLYIVYTCKKVSKGIISDSPTAPTSMYM